MDGEGRGGREKGEERVGKGLEEGRGDEKGLEENQGVLTGRPVEYCGTAVRLGLLLCSKLGGKTKVLWGPLMDGYMDQVPT